MAFETVRIRSTLNGVNPVVGTREDAAAGDTVQLSLTDTAGVSSVRWDLVGRPEHSVAGGGSLPAVLSTGLTAAFNIDADIGSVSLDGTYVVHAILNEGSPASRRISVVIARSSGLTIPAPGGGTSILRRLGAFESLEDTISIPNVLQGWATMLNRWLRWAVINIGGGGVAEVVHPFYALDYDGGDDNNVGFSDVSMADAGTKAKKTWEGLLAIIPADGKGATIDIGIKGRAAGATYLQQDGVTPAPLDIRPLSKYVVRFYATEDFSLSAEDQKRQSPVIAPGCSGPNGDGSFTITGVAGNVITIGGGGLPTDATGRVRRLRVYDPGAPNVTKYVRGIKRINGNDITVMAASIAGVAINDVCVIEEPGTVFSEIHWWGGTSGIRADDGVETLSVDGQALVLHGIGAAAGGASSFVGGDVYMEFCNFEGDLVTRVSYLESMAYTAGVGLRCAGAPGVGANLIVLEESGCVYLADFSYFTCVEIELRYCVLSRSIISARGGDSDAGGSYMNSVRFTSSAADTIRGGAFTIFDAERWNGGIVEFTGNAMFLYFSGMTGANGSLYPIRIDDLVNSDVNLRSMTVLPTGYTQLASIPQYGFIQSQADWDLLFNTYGMRDSKGNIYNNAGAQVTQDFRVGVAGVSPFRAVRLSGVADQVTEAIATSVANGRVRGVTMAAGNPSGGAPVVGRGVSPLDMTDGLGLAYVPNTPVYLSDVTAGKGTVTAPGIPILIGYIVANSTVANRPYVDVIPRTQD